MKYSIIIPVYNTKEIFFRECIESILEQTYKNYEIIIIDDGSNEETKKIINEYKMEKVIVKSIENSGVSNARNVGTEIASGDYLLYVDSDDMISKRYLERLNSILCKEKYDLILSQVTFDKELIFQNNTYKILLDENIKNTLRKYYLSFCNEKLRTNSSWINRGPVARCIKSKIAKNNKFDVNMAFAEDVIWNLKLLNTDINVAIMLSPEYYYRVNLGSATQGYRKNFENELYDILQKIKENIESNLISSPEYATACFEYYRIYLKLYLYHKNNDLTYLEKYKKLKVISNFIKKEMNNQPVLFGKKNYKQKILYFLFKYKLYIMIHLLENR